jgi:hypothetical protein
MEHADGLNWRKSSYSGGNGGACVEVADHDGVILVRDTNDHGQGSVQRFTPGEWRVFVADIRNGELRPAKAGHLP